MSDQQYWFFLYRLLPENGQHELFTRITQMAGETSLATLHHDHLFVGQADAERALQVLRNLAANAE